MYICLLFVSQQTHVLILPSPMATSVVAMAIQLHMETPVSFTVTWVEGHQVGKVTEHVSVKPIGHGVDPTSNVQVKILSVWSVCLILCYIHNYPRQFRQSGWRKRDHVGGGGGGGWCINGRKWQAPIIVNQQACTNYASMHHLEIIGIGI